MNMIIYISKTIFRRKRTRTYAHTPVGKEKIMDQTRQFKKVKLFRALKIAFYMLGFPLFIGIVFLSIIRYLGHDPFVGEANLTQSTGIFKGAEMMLTSSALFGLWIALGIWLIITIVHVILSKTVKSPRARMISVVALTMAVMMGCVFGMDAVFEAKITEMRQNAPEGVVVNDYKTQLSYYRHVSTNADGKNDTFALIERVRSLQDVYHIEMGGQDFSGTAGNISNKPVTYYNIISDDGKQGVDISFVKEKKKDENGKDVETGLYKLAVDNTDDHNIIGDNKITKDVEGQQLVRLAPNANGQLVINGKLYSHYICVERWPKDGTKIYSWYTKEMYPVTTKFENNMSMGNEPADGVYGEGVYNRSGLLGDGWVFSLENALAILEDYYEGQAEIEKYTKLADSSGIFMNGIRKKAEEYRIKYYNGEALPNGEQLPEEDRAFIKTLFNQETELSERFSLTKGELDSLVSKLGGLLGNNSAFDYLLQPNGEGLAGLGSISDIIQPAIESLTKGMSLGGIINNAETMKTVVDVIKSILPAECKDIPINDIYIMLAYTGATDAMGVTHDGLYLAVVKDSGVQQEDGKYVMGTNPERIENGGDILLDIDFRDVLLEEDANNPDYLFDLDHLSTFLNTAINGLLGHFSIDLKKILVDNAIGKLIGGLIIKDIDVKEKDEHGNMQTVSYKGLVISGISIPLFDQEYNAKINVSGILQNLLDGLYSYQSSVFKPAWEFYEAAVGNNPNANKVALVKAYAKFERAQYEATVHGKMVGSVLIGDTLGTGSYPASFGLGDLVSVRQVQSDLSYKPVFYPLYSLRDMLMLFTGLVVLFYFLSFVAHEKEIDYATGKLIAGKKQKSGKKDKHAKEEQDVVKDENAENVNENVDAKDADATQNGDTALPVDENTEKEVR